MNTIECIYDRRSVRSFTDKDVDNETLKKIAEAGLEAPTAMNSRDMVLTIIKGDTLSKINEAMKDSLGDMAAHFYMGDRFSFYRGGKAVIVVSFGEKSVLPLQNTGCVMENMYLAATELGLGACWINQFCDFSNEKIVELLGLEKGYKPYAGLSVGYIDVLPEKKDRNGSIVILD